MSNVLSPNIDNTEQVQAINQGLKATGGLLRKGAANVYRLAKNNPREAGIATAAAIGGVAISNADPLMLAGSALAGGYLLSKYKIKRPGTFSIGLFEVADFASYPYIKDDNNNLPWRTAQENTVAKDGTKDKIYSQPKINSDGSLVTQKKLNKKTGVLENTDVPVRTSQQLAYDKQTERNTRLKERGVKEPDFRKAVKTLKDSADLREDLHILNNTETVRQLSAAKDSVGLDKVSENKLNKAKAELDAIARRQQARGVRPKTPEQAASNINSNSAKVNELEKAYTTVKKASGNVNINKKLETTKRGLSLGQDSKYLFPPSIPADSIPVSSQPIETTNIPITPPSTPVTPEPMSNTPSLSSADTTIPKSKGGGKAAVKQARIAADASNRNGLLNYFKDVYSQGIDTGGKIVGDVVQTTGNVAGKVVDAVGGVVKEVAGVPKQMAANVGTGIETIGNVKQADINAKSAETIAKINATANAEKSASNVGNKATGLLGNISKAVTSRKGLLIGGGLAAAGAGLLGGKMYLDYQKEKEDRDREFELQKIYANAGRKR